MKVLLLAQHVARPDDEVPPHGSGSHTAATLAGLQLHHDVLALFADGSGAGDSRVRHVVRRLVPGWLRAFRHDVRVLRDDRRFAARALAAAREFGPDVVYARSEYLCLDGVRVARQVGVPLVLEVNGLLATDARSMYRSPLEPLGAALERYKHRRADVIVTVSPGLADLLEDYGADPRKVAVVPNSVAPQRVRPRDAVARAPVVVGWIGHLMQWHVEALELLIEASPAVPDVSFLIIGGGPGLEDLESLARRAGVAGRFRFLGVVPYEEVPARLEEVDVGVIPAVFEYAFPVKLVEFGAAGIPVVAPQSASLDRQLVPYEEYEPFEAGNGAALAAALAHLAGDSERRDLLGRALQRAVTERYTWDATGRALGDIVARVVAGRDVSSGS